MVLGLLLLAELALAVLLSVMGSTFRQDLMKVWDFAC